jgi:hypothetical protein
VFHPEVHRIDGENAIETSVWVRETAYVPESQHHSPGSDFCPEPVLGGLDHEFLQAHCLIRLNFKRVEGRVKCAPAGK